MTDVVARRSARQIDPERDHQEQQEQRVEARAGTAGAAGTLLLTVLVAAQFVAVLDTSIVNVAAPDMRTDLRASGSGLQLVIAGYTTCTRCC